MLTRFLVVAILVASLAACSGGGMDDGADVFDKVSASTVLIEVGITNGSGFVVDGGYVVTNQHVVGYSPTALVLVPGSGEFVELDVVGLDVHRDLAVLGPLEDPPSGLEWADSTEVDIGEDVWAVGYPGRRGPGASPHVADGLLAQRRDMELYDHTYLEFSEAAAGGHSGGPMVDENGDVLGVTTLHVTEARFLVALSAEDAAAAVAGIIADGGTDIAGDAFDDADGVMVEPRSSRIFRFVVDEETDIDLTASARLDIFLEVTDPVGYAIESADDPPIDYFDPSVSGDGEFENDFYADATTTAEESLEATLRRPGAYLLTLGTFSRFATAEVDIESNVALTEIRENRDEEIELVLGEVSEGVLTGVGRTGSWFVDLDEGDRVRIVVDSVDPVLAVVRDDAGNPVGSSQWTDGRTIGFILDFEMEVEEAGRYEIEIGSGGFAQLALSGYRILVESL